MPIVKSEFFDQHLGDGEEELGHLVPGHIDEIVACELPRRATVPHVGVSSVGVDTIDHCLLPVTQDLDAVRASGWVDVVAEIFPNGRGVLNRGRLGARPTRTGIISSAIFEPLLNKFLDLDGGLRVEDVDITARIVSS